MTVMESPTSAVVRVNDETELMAILRGDDPDPIGPGETPRFIYRGRASDAEAEPGPRQCGEAVRRVEAAIGRIGLDDAGQAWRERLAAMGDAEREDVLCLLADLYGVPTGVRAMTANPHTALYFANHHADGSAAGEGVGMVRRVRVSDFFEAAGAAGGNPPRLADVSTVPPTVAARATAQQAVALLDLPDGFADRLRDVGGWQMFLFRRGGPSHAKSAAQLMPTDDPMLDALREA